MKEGFYYLPPELPQTPEPDQDQDPWGETVIVGSPLPRVDAYERVSGSADYPSDVNLPGMLYGAILRCPHARATIREIDTSIAEKLPGVLSVITSQTPEADIGWHYEGDKLVASLFDVHCRFEGEAVAAVAAETPHQAHDALRAIKIDYEVLPQVSDYRRALDEGTPSVWETRDRAGEPDFYDQETDNRSGESQIYERGDLETGFVEADHIVEETFSTESQIHVPLERHGCAAKWDGDKLTVWESTQGVYSIQRRLAATLNLPLSNVRVICHFVGGAFGGKLQAGKYTVIASILAKLSGRPVKLFLSLEESLLCVGNRPANQMRLKAGVKNDGTITAIEFEALGSGGAYAGSGTGALDWQIRDLYNCPNVRTTLHNVFINAGDQRPMRAPGHPQCSWALEQMMDQLAEAIDMDPVELRLKNFTDVSQARGNIPYTSTGLRECLSEGAVAFGWKEALSRQPSDDAVVRGVGMASCLWVAGAGGPPSTVILKYFVDGSVNLNMGASDIGTGTKTVMAMVVAEELGVAVDRIQIEHADTGTTQYATSSGGSKTVPTESPAVRAAAIDCKNQLVALAAKDLELPIDRLELRGEAVVDIQDEEKKVAVSGIKGLRRQQVLVGVGYRGPNPDGKATCPFAAQFCEVEVNKRTGEVTVVRFVGAHDSGRVMSRLTYDNQVYGGITMGIGFGMTERRVLDHQRTGKMTNLSWHDYKIPTALDVPADMTSLPIDTIDIECNTTGAKGLGEPVTIPTAAAIANAVYNAVGVRVTDTPINPTQLLEMIAQANQETG